MQQLGELYVYMHFIITQDMLKVLKEEVDYDKLPKDDISLVEKISIKSCDVSMSERNSVVDLDDESICITILQQKKSITEIDESFFSFLDSEHQDDIDIDMCSDCGSHDYYTSNKLRNSAATTDSGTASDSATTSGSTNIDSGIDSHAKFSV